MSPDRSLLRPDAILVLLFELLGNFAQHRVVVSRFVAAHASPIDRLRRGLGFRVTLDDLAISPLRLRPSLMHKGDPGKSHLQLRAELGIREVAFDPPSLFSVGVQYQRRGGPQRVEPVKVGGVLFYVGFEWQKILVDERRCIRVGV